MFDVLRFEVFDRTVVVDACCSGLEDALFGFAEEDEAWDDDLDCDEEVDPLRPLPRFVRDDEGTNKGPVSPNISISQQSQAVKEEPHPNDAPTNGIE